MRRRYDPSPRLSGVYPAFDGLNLSSETLEGLVKHNGPLTLRNGSPIGHYRDAGCRMRSGFMAGRTIQGSRTWKLELCQRRSSSCRHRRRHPYDAHDIDDGLRAGLFALEELASVPLISNMLKDTCRENPQLEANRVVKLGRRCARTSSPKPQTACRRWRRGRLMMCVMPIGRSSGSLPRWKRLTAPSRAFSTPGCIVIPVWWCLGDAEPFAPCLPVTAKSRGRRSGGADRRGGQADRPRRRDRRFIARHDRPLRADRAWAA